MKLDSFFNRFFREYPPAFFELIGEDQKKAAHYQFKSVEVKELAFRFDGIFLPTSKKHDLYFVEVQFQKKPRFYAEFFAEIFIYLKQYDLPNDWRAVAIFPDASIDPGIHHHYREFFDSGRLQRIHLLPLLREKQLDKFPLNLLQIIFDSKQHTLSTVKRITRQLPNEIHDLHEQEKFIDLLIYLLMSKFSELSREEVKKMVEPLLSDIKESRFYQEIAEEIAQDLKFSDVKKSRFYQEIAEGIGQELTPKIKREIAEALLLRKMSLEFTVEVTGLSQKEVRAIKRELAARKN